MARHAFECGLHLATIIGLEYVDLQSHRASRGFLVTQRRPCHIHIGRIDEHRHASCSRDQFTKQFEPLCSQLNSEKADGGEVATRNPFASRGLIEMSFARRPELRSEMRIGNPSEIE